MLALVQVRNFLDPQSLEGLSVGTMLLALVGNCLMVPRARFVKDPIWTLGTTWAVVAGWGQLLSMFIRTAPETGCAPAALWSPKGASGRRRQQHGER